MPFPLSRAVFPLAPVRIARKQQLKLVGRYPESECNPLKALRKTFRRNTVTKAGGFYVLGLEHKKRNLKTVSEAV